MDRLSHGEAGTHPSTVLHRRKWICDEHAAIASIIEQQLKK
jgi:hypothetical protein